MDIRNLIDKPGDRQQTSSSTSSPTLESTPLPPRRQTVSSLLNEDEDGSPQTRRSSYASSTNGNDRRQSIQSLLSDTTPTHPEPPYAQQRSESTPSRPRRKPKRYDRPPIWAQNWTGAREDSRPATGVVPSPSPGGPRGRGSSQPQVLAPRPIEGTNSLGFQSTISGVLPHEDLTRKVVEWVFSNISLLGEDKSYIELEIKLGAICAKSNEKRIQLPVLTECVLDPRFTRAETFFEAQLSDAQFSLVNQFLDGLCDDKKVLTRQSIRTKDHIYSHPNKPDKLRVTYDERDTPIERMVKRRVADMMVFSPGDLLDLRISLNVELPASRTDISDQGKPAKIRSKNRLSYAAQGMQFDLTSVISDNAARSSKELEIEVNKSLILELIDNFERNKDVREMEKFEDLIRIAIDNARVLNRKLSR
ncbi:hypothetical protein TRVA0_033S00364 [Trichomonascus vanleenenianus]|uniref:polynucleotide 5'-phosphatase n=1 Tax=Trichomonascus vanleenenianus TaxID=2268995 RepID=UPI003ECA248C